MILDKGWGVGHLDCWLHEGTDKEIFGGSLGVASGLRILVFLLQGRALGAPSHGDWLGVGRVVVGGGLVGALDGTAAHGTLGAHNGLVTFKIQDLHSELFIFGFQLGQAVGQGGRLFLSLLTGNSGALAVLDETVLVFGEDATHQDEALDGHGIEIDLEETNPQGF